MSVLKEGPLAFGYTTSIHKQCFNYTELKEVGVRAILLLPLQLLLTHLYGRNSVRVCQDSARIDLKE